MFMVICFGMVCADVFGVLRRYGNMGNWCANCMRKESGKVAAFYYNNYGGYYRFSGGHRWIIIIYLLALWKLYGKYLDND